MGGRRGAGERSHLLDGGSTVGALAHALRDRENLSVTTPGINTLQELADSPGHPGGLPGRTTPRASARPSWVPSPRQPWSG